MISGAPSAEQTSTVRNVAAAAAHDLANLLSIMGINLNALASEPLSPRAADAVRSLRAETVYLRGLARELQMAAMESEASAADRGTRLVAWWPGVRTLLRAMHGEGVTVRADIPWGLPAVGIESHNLTQVVLNVVGNAAHAIAEGAAASDRSGQRTRAPQRGQIAISARLAADGAAVHLSLADNGAGMSPQVLARACEPFYTTRSACGGTGLGLAIVRRLVGDVGGIVRLSSAVGAGATVTLELPIRAEKHAAPD
jgi:signal transduction histidine kinase